MLDNIIFSVYLIKDIIENNIKTTIKDEDHFH